MKPIRLAIVGCGGFVRHFHARHIRDDVPEFRVVALADHAKASAEALAVDSFAESEPAVFTDHRKMLEEVRPDAVIVSTPHTLHFRHCADALAAGSHVMVEKPMVTNSGDARKLVALAKRKRRVLQVAIQGMYTDTFAYARQLLRDGTMGPLQIVTGIMAQGWMKGTKGKWRQNPRLSGGGQLYDSSAHVISAMMYLVDEPAREVLAFTDNKGCRVDINGVVGIRFAGGCLGSISSGGNCAAWKSHLVLQGENAVMEISPHGGNFRVYGKGLKQEITAVPRGWKIPSVTPARNFADAILGRAKPRVAGRMGIFLADLMDAIYASARTGRTARVTGRAPSA